MLITIRSLMFATGKGIGAFGLGGAILWYVAVHCGPQNGIAYIHVSTPNVEVMVDDVQYHVETQWEYPARVRAESWTSSALRNDSRAEKLFLSKGLVSASERSLF